MSSLPSRMLTDSILLHIPAGVTVWQAPTQGTDIRLFKVHVQRHAGMNVNSLNNEVQTQATVWYDCKLSKPYKLDFLALKKSAEAVGAGLIIEFGGVRYSVSRVIECKDGFGKLHHYEIEVV